MTAVLLIRHAGTRGNADGRWDVWSDPPLTTTGRIQAEALARRLAREEPPLETIDASPLQRAR